MTIDEEIDELRTEIQVIARQYQAAFLDQVKPLTNRLIFLYKIKPTHASLVDGQLMEIPNDPAHHQSESDQAIGS